MKVVVIGGAGFIGINSAHHFLSKGDDVVIFDNFSRHGSEFNISWIKAQYPSVVIMKGDIRYQKDCEELFSCHQDVELILLLAGQVAVTTSVENPRDDFMINALGTLNVLESVRNKCRDAVLLLSSTNKVYGNLGDENIIEKERRYDFSNPEEGDIAESKGLDLHSPYGCSKGAADQYTRDYARIFGLRTIVFRQSCIYGPRQFGIEEQGWIAWFMIASALGRPITIYGDGKQVRDVLFVDELIHAFTLAFENIDRTAGQIYNIGGGRKYTLSLLEFIVLLEKITGNKLPIRYEGWRSGDQKIYVSNIRKANDHFGWEPIIPMEEALSNTYCWIKRNKEVFPAE